MKTLSILIVSLFLQCNLFAQKDIINYENPYFEFFNNNSLKEISKDNYTRVDLSKLKFETNTENDKKFVDIPFYVNKNITEGRDFLFSMLFYQYNNVDWRWAILKEDKTSIVKSLTFIKNDEGKTIGVYQRNKNLKETIQPGKYYIRLFFKQKPKEKVIFYFYVGNVLIE